MISDETRIIRCIGTTLDCTRINKLIMSEKNLGPAYVLYRYTCKLEIYN